MKPSSERLRRSETICGRQNRKLSWASLTVKRFANYNGAGDVGVTDEDDDAPATYMLPSGGAGDDPKP